MWPASRPTAFDYPNGSVPILQLCELEVVFQCETEEAGEKPGGQRTLAPAALEYSVPSRRGAAASLQLKPWPRTCQGPKTPVLTVCRPGETREKPQPCACQEPRISAPANIWAPQRTLRLQTAFSWDRYTLATDGATTHIFSYSSKQNLDLF
uniref:Uncharacterized protein n=1 Tax=Chelonoidis abingdonii TaxID=106734 RepID=A0A8C0JEG9_CHEAB